MLRYARLLSKNIFMARSPPKLPLLVVLGATGTGKSQVFISPFTLPLPNLSDKQQLAVELAKRFNGEIINGDAMQMYRGLPIVTNKITPSEQDGIPHHLLGFIALDEEPWRVTNFKKRAQQIIHEIRSRGCLPILVGGTHYYTQSLLFKDSAVGEEGGGEGEGEMSSLEIAEKFPVLEGGTEEMLEMLRAADPVMAERWHPKDRRKIRRSLEIFLMTGRKASDVYAEQKMRKAEPSVAEIQEELGVELTSTLLFWVHADSEVLKQRLDARVDKMIDSGLTQEVISMQNFLQDQEKLGITVDRGRGIWVSIGWKEFEDYLKALESGTATKEELQKLHDLSVEKTQAATRQYAKRQIRWIRLKLITALAEEQAQHQIYLLDGTDVSKWETEVSTSAIRVTETFLKGLEMESPLELSAAARIHLALEDAQAAREVSFFQRECTTCSTIVTTEKQWEIHLQSRRHRSLTKRKEKKFVRDMHSQRESDDVSSTEDVA